MYDVKKPCDQREREREREREFKIYYYYGETTIKLH